MVGTVDGCGYDGQQRTLYTMMLMAGVINMHSTDHIGAQWSCMLWLQPHVVYLALGH